MTYANTGLYVVMVCLIILVNARTVFTDPYVKMLITVITLLVSTMDRAETTKKRLHAHVQMNGLVYAAKKKTFVIQQILAVTMLTVSKWTYKYRVPA